MIVLSILTALGFERAAIALHDRAAARDSKVRIERELMANAADLRTSIAKNTAGMEQARTILKALLAAMEAGKADSAAVSAIMSDTLSAHMSVNTVTWQQDAWDAAIADQSASHLDQADLQRYAYIYAEARGATESFKLVISGQLIAQVPEVLLSSMLNKMDAHDCALLLMRYITTVQQIDGVEAGLADELSEQKKKG
jgi:hypothetical protein